MQPNYARRLLAQLLLELLALAAMAVAGCLIAEAFALGYTVARVNLAVAFVLISTVAAYSAAVLSRKDGGL